MGPVHKHKNHSMNCAEHIKSVRLQSARQLNKPTMFKRSSLILRTGGLSGGYYFREVYEPFKHLDLITLDIPTYLHTVRELSSPGMLLEVKPPACGQPCVDSFPVKL